MMDPAIYGNKYKIPEEPLSIRLAKAKAIGQLFKIVINEILNPYDDWVDFYHSNFCEEYDKEDQS